MKTMGPIVIGHVSVVFSNGDEEFYLMIQSLNIKVVFKNFYEQGNNFLFFNITYFMPLINPNYVTRVFESNLLTPKRSMNITRTFSIL